MTSIERRSLFVIATCVVLGCASTPESVERVRADLREAEADPAVASGASVELHEARKAVDRLEEAADDDASDTEIEHLVYLADQKIQIARTAATEEQMRRQVDELAQKREQLRLRARSTVADRATARAEAAEADATAARRELEQARARAEQIEIEFQSVQARETERGLILTMRDDVLFAVDSAELQPGARDALDEVARFLKEYPDRALAIEGHTDDTGSDAYNQSLSTRRAESVARELERDGVPRARIDVRGFGESKPIAPNDNAAGRQQNRRVEIVVENPRQIS